MPHHTPPVTGPLAGLRVLDMSRILAGPSATQMLGDLGADVVKVERPDQGDDTRKWGPPYLKDAEGRDSTESSYYLSANRNKRSLTLDFTKPEGRALALRLIGHADVLVENYKTGTLAKYGLGYEDLRDAYPRLIYLSLTGFGQTGPYAARAGYDFLIQGMGGIMSLTGETEGEPMKAGVAIADLMAGMYSGVAILAALRHRDQTGRGQHIDMSLLDAQVAWLSNAGQYFLTSGQPTPRYGNGHPTIVPYQTFRAADDWIILAVGNDEQFRKFCAFAGKPELAADPRFATNRMRVTNRAELVPMLEAVIAAQPTSHWLEGLEPLGVPAGPINGIPAVFADPQVQARGMRVEMQHPVRPDPVSLIGSPMKFSSTPVNYRYAPPTLGQHTDEVLGDWLRMQPAEVEKLRGKGVV
ncbi:CaiB/BaiF CoA transferase family protein [Indioceanicola profundi]|uniref:CaiB/BaiF CoA transferase family protein n=1 Tax=Indioceanicola profundi TaxID=2220096 RepID=UPI000E6ACF57|nr:CaiB/BaiF CoA-transferase family protein [Indioceanicola profundi]